MTGPFPLPIMPAMPLVRVAKKDDIQDGYGKACRAGEKTVAIFKCGEAYYATENRCPHRGGPLSEGDLTGTVVTCPWHGWQFDVTNGQNPQHAEMKVATYPVSLDGDDVCVEMP